MQEGRGRRDAAGRGQRRERPPAGRPAAPGVPRPLHSGRRTPAARPLPTSPRLPPENRSQRGDTRPLCGLIVRPVRRRPAPQGRGPRAGSPPHARGPAGVLAEPAARRGGPASLRPVPETLGRGGGPPQPPQGVAARSARPAHPRYLPSGRASRRLAGAPPRSEGSERLPSAGQPWPAPYVKRRRLRRHSAEGGRRRTAAAPLRYPATGLSAQPTGRAPYPSAQEPGLHQRHRPAPAPPLRPALGFPTRAGERRALEPGGALLLPVGAGSRREVGGQEAGAHPVCGA
ncbi:nascent polypeptide-associated complex subunit alpha, muscle-specific form-like [Sagmatias obliquidens]|uniref:nascent polypeptide-associated complex subunit alpha, muscle-specific form-like n=1 Tax=Sagmatias obliquidens TaxID=3371155 RepID=UPI000F43FBB0|nr:nascent polypeptide-associated complex subunit alpha, muscle-specific form-like [Lagenorhynchus obliquidens]